MILKPLTLWKKIGPSPRLALVSGVVLALFWLVTADSYVPFKDEDNYLRGAAEWLRALPLRTPAFVPLHALIPEMLGGPESRWLLLRIFNVVWMSLAVAGLVALGRRLGLSRQRAMAVAALFLLQTVTLVSGMGMLAEPLALACLWWGMVWVLRARPSRCWPAVIGGAFLLGLAAMGRIELGPLAAVFLIAWACARPKRHMLAALLASVVVGLLWQLPSIINWAFGGGYHPLRGHPAVEIGAGMQRAAPVQYLISLWEFVTVADSRMFLLPLRLAGLAGAVVLILKSRRRMLFLAVFGAGSAVLGVTSFSDVARGGELVGRYYLPTVAITCLGCVGLWRLRVGLPWLRKAVAWGFVAVMGAGPVYYAVNQDRYWPVEFLALKRHFADRPELRQLRIHAPFGGNEYSLGVRPVLANADLPVDTSPEAMAAILRERGVELLIIQERWINAPRTRGWAGAFLSTAIERNAADGGLATGIDGWVVTDRLLADAENAASPALYILRRRDTVDD